MTGTIGEPEELQEIGWPPEFDTFMHYYASLGFTSFSEYLASLGVNVDTRLEPEGWHDNYRLRAHIYFADDGTVYVLARYRVFDSTPGPSHNVYYRGTIPQLRQLLERYGIWGLDHNLERCGITAPDYPELGVSREYSSIEYAMIAARRFTGNDEIWMTPDRTFGVVQHGLQGSVFVLAGDPVGSHTLTRYLPAAARDAAPDPETPVHQLDFDGWRFSVTPKISDLRTILADDQPKPEYVVYHPLIGYVPVEGN